MFKKRKIKIKKRNNYLGQAINTKNALDGGTLTIEGRKSHDENNLPKKGGNGENNGENLEPDNKKHLENIIKIYPNNTINDKKSGKKFKILIAVLSIIALILLVPLLCYFFVIKKKDDSKGVTEKKEENQNNEEKDEENSKEIVKINE
jgi:hypothetical protein